MSTRHEKMRKFVRWYKQEYKKTAVTMAEVAQEAIARGWKLPPPISAEERLAKQFADAEREEIRYDETTKEPYRGNLALTQRLKDGTQLPLWVDTDEATRPQMVMALHKYREQMLGEAIIGTNTAEHWNRTHPEQQPLPFSTDLADEVQWRKNAPEEGAA
jgi:hypothetical protein